MLISIGLVGIAAMLVWALSSPAGLSAKPPAAAPAAASVEAAQPSATTAAAPAQQNANNPVPAAVAPLPVIDLFEGALPTFMAEAHADTLQQKWLDVEMQKQLYAYGREHRDDARPQLLLAWDSMNRDWKGIAVRMYGIAYRADPRAKGDPSMLQDLVEIASQYDTVEYRESSAILRDAFGAQAVPHIDQEIAELSATGDSKRVERLQRLRRDVTVPR